MSAHTPYRAIFCDVRTDRTIDILPLRDVSIDDYIGKPGALSGTIPIPDSAIAARVARIEEGRTAVYLERGGDLWWGGIIWTSTLQSDGRGVLSLSLQAATFDSYATRRRIRADLAFPPTDQLELARELWRHLQRAEGGDIGVTYGTESSGRLQSASWRDGDEVLYSEAIEGLAASENGFEQQISVFRDPVTGNRTRQLRLGSPRIHTGVTDLVLDRPGAILSYSFPRDATRGGTTSRARGASVNANQAEESRPVYSDELVAQDLIDGGWPRIDLASDHNTVGDKAALTSLAAAELAQARGAVVIPAITIRLGGVVPPTLLGRTTRIRITDEWHPEGLDARYRIIGAKVTPPERGRPDTAELYLEEV
ncbi:hypothetical protein AB0P12_31480 [Streptomyces subrutilus]|uniref:Uncharacterized protein n=1 Tax=Streptomyces subrutilus TaxID=36818 RepID=A0A5P2ULU5_9ACTN|nr:hypothetical protein [Streptomyces subrutilus]QEU79305.1 hypothetical protein CP968_14130 [Streptomyces subrutilus]GGZ53500.1 hypothetical protein GCM10010371_11300 [Streptomyces subrutilus]